MASPFLLTGHPILGAKLAAELGRQNISHEIREDLRQQVQSRSEFTEEKREAFGYAVSETDGEAAKFLVGRFEGIKGQTETLKDGQLHFSTLPNPGATEVHDFFGFPMKGSQLNKVTEEMGVTEDNFLTYNFAKSPEGWVDKSLVQTPFLATVGELLEQSHVQAFHKADVVLKSRNDEAGRLENLQEFMNKHLFHKKLA